MIRLIKAYLDLFAAALEAKAAELREYGSKLPEREYYRGYQDGVSDAQEKWGGGHDR